MRLTENTRLAELPENLQGVYEQLPPDRRACKGS